MKDSEGAKVVEVDTEGSTELPHQVAVHHCFHKDCTFKQTNNDSCCQVEKGTDGSFVFSGK